MDTTRDGVSASNGGTGILRIVRSGRLGRMAGIASVGPPLRQAVRDSILWYGHHPRRRVGLERWNRDPPHRPIWSTRPNGGHRVSRSSVAAGGARLHPLVWTPPETACRPRTVEPGSSASSDLVDSAEWRASRQ